MAHIKVINIDSELKNDFHAVCAKRGVSMTKRLIELMEQDVSFMKLSTNAPVLNSEQIDELLAIAKKSEELKKLSEDALSKEEIAALRKLIK